MSDSSPDSSPQKRSLSEISHLFLSSVRDLHDNGTPRPQRTPPGGVPKPKPMDISIDLTPEEFAQVFGGADEAAAEKSESAHADAPRSARVPSVTAVIGGHLNGKQFDRVKEYARHLSGSVGRVGLIELDASEFRLMCFEPAAQGLSAVADPQSAECYDARQMAEALEEMNWDVDHWLLLLPSPRTPEAKALLREVDHWVLLSTCDHDGVVSSYRMLKGLADLHRPRLTLALLDAADEVEAGRVLAKLSGVCQQFLDWPVHAETVVHKETRVAEHLILFCRPTRDKAQLATAPQWMIVSEFLTAAKVSAIEAAVDAEAAVASLAARSAEEIIIPATPAQEEARRLVADVIVPHLQAEAAAATQEALPEIPTMKLASATEAPAMTGSPDASVTEVIDLPAEDARPGSILTAILHNVSSGLVECPVRAPMCADVRLAVSRERGLVLLAVASEGLSDLRVIGQAYRWLIENRDLIGMAVPQFAIDPKVTPRLRVLVNQTDLSAEILQPLLQSEQVTVQAYRKVRWGSKLGLFLAAA